MKKKKEKYIEWWRYVIFRPGVPEVRIGEKVSPRFWVRPEAAGQRLHLHSKIEGTLFLALQTDQGRQKSVHFFLYGIALKATFPLNFD